MEKANVLAYFGHQTTDNEAAKASLRLEMLHLEKGREECSSDPKTKEKVPRCKKSLVQSVQTTDFIDSQIRKVKSPFLFGWTLLACFVASVARR
ncbi:hypothetical protein SRHO_G00283600 [Serrasalmus rhombeus]